MSCITQLVLKCGSKLFQVKAFTCVTNSGINASETLYWHGKPKTTTTVELFSVMEKETLEKTVNLADSGGLYLL